MSQREIKFRGQSIDFPAGWIYGYFYIAFGDSYIMTNKGISYKLISETAQQYTGLKDKNGKEIYEGDIVTYIYHEGRYDIEDYEGDYPKQKKKDVVRFQKGQYTPRPRCEECEDSYYTYGYYEFEVIGNIIETPELL